MQSKIVKMIEKNLQGAGLHRKRLLFVIRYESVEIVPEN